MCQGPGTGANLPYDERYHLLGSRSMVNALVSRVRGQCHTVKIESPPSGTHKDDDMTRSITPGPPWTSTVEQRDQHRQSYVSSVLSQYCRLSATTGLVCRRDRRLAIDLFERGVPLAAVEAAFVLVTVRRSLRSPHARPTDPIRSLHYFSPIIDQILTNPPDLGPLHYLSFKIDSLDDLRNECRSPRQPQ